MIAEAERQAKAKFPNKALPDPSKVVTLHVRGGDKPGEVGEKTPAEYLVHAGGRGEHLLLRMKGLEFPGACLPRLRG